MPFQLFRQWEPPTTLYDFAEVSIELGLIMV
jgi:hypothetical protein